MRNFPIDFKSRGFANLSEVLRWTVRVAPIILAAVSGYLLFLVIIPFFILGVYKAPYADIVSGKIDYATQMGFLPWLGTAYAALMTPLTPILWLISAINLGLTRRWYIAVLLALSPLPVIYFLSGPYAVYFFDWTAPG